MSDLADAAREALKGYPTRKEGEHLWFEARGITSCALCGHCQRADGRNKSCTGLVSVRTR